MKIITLVFLLGVSQGVCAMSKDKTTNITRYVPGVGKVTKIMTKHANGCSTHTTIFTQGGFVTTQRCPSGAKKR